MGATEALPTSDVTHTNGKAACVAEGLTSSAAVALTAVRLRFAFSRYSAPCFCVWNASARALLHVWRNWLAGFGDRAYVNFHE